MCVCLWLCVCACVCVRACQCPVMVNVRMCSDQGLNGVALKVARSGQKPAKGKGFSSTVDTSWPFLCWLFGSPHNCWAAINLSMIKAPPPEMQTKAGAFSSSREGIHLCQKTLLVKMSQTPIFLPGWSKLTCFVLEIPCSYKDLSVLMSGTNGTSIKIELAIKRKIFRLGYIWLWGRTRCAFICYGCWGGRRRPGSFLQYARLGKERKKDKTGKERNKNMGKFINV